MSEREEGSGASRVAGGYRLVAIDALCAAWSSYRAGRIHFCDLRVWLAAHEQHARRAAAGRVAKVRYRLAELRTLTGGRGPAVASLARLRRAGLLEWAEDRIEFPFPPDPQAERMLSLIPNNRRLLPVPRRALRFLAGCSRPTLVATILGHLLRCVYSRREAVSAEGCCPAAWIAEVFGVDVRNVRRAKKTLASMGWLEVLPSPHWHRQRWGGKVRVNLAWGPPLSRPDCRAHELPRRARRSTTVLPRPDPDKDLLRRDQHQKPGSARPTGARVAHRRTGPPTLRDVTLPDLRSPSRLEQLWGQALGRGWVRGSDAERLNFFASAAHAARVGDRNPPGLFVAVLRRGLWRVLSQADEERGRALLYQAREHATPARESRGERPPAPRQPTASRQRAEACAPPPVTASERDHIRSLIARSLRSVAF